MKKILFISGNGTPSNPLDPPAKMTILSIEDASAGPNVYVALAGDNTDGLTDATAWNNLASVQSDAVNWVAGSIIRFKGGDEFLGSFSVDIQGSIGNPITITSYGIGKGTIKMSAGNTMFQEANYITFDNIIFDNSLAPSTIANWWLIGKSSNIIIRNVDFVCKTRPTRFSSLTLTGLLENILIEDSNFLMASGVGGTEPCLSINEDGQTYDMNILIQRNFFEGGTQYWGQDGYDPNFSTIDISGSGIRVLNNVVHNAQYMGAAINIEDCNGVLTEVANNTIYIDIFAVGNESPEYYGILLSNSTNANIHNNTIIGSETMRSLLSRGVFCNIKTGNAGDVLVDDNNIDGVMTGVAISVSTGNTTGNHKYYFRRNIIRNFNIGSDIFLRDSDIGNSVNIDDNIFYLDEGTVGIVATFSSIAVTSNNTNCYFGGNTLDFTDRITNYSRGVFSGAWDNSTLKSLNIGTNTVVNAIVTYDIPRDFWYIDLTPLAANKIFFDSLDTYISNEIDLSQGTQFLQTWANIGHREGIYDVSFQYVEGSSIDAGIQIDIYFSTTANIGTGTERTYTTEANQSGTVSKNWRELGNANLPTSTEDNLSIRCERNKIGSGSIIITIRTFKNY